MTDTKKICVITGTRAEYGLLSLTMKEISCSSHLELGLVATGTHLSKDFGETYTEIEKDGFQIDYKMPILNSNDSSNDTLHSMSEILKKLPKFLDKFQPDLILVLGDRYEIFASVSVALISNIPVAHIHGGELTEGAFDEAMRHAITKMSHIHFTTNNQHAKRVIQMGENPEYVFNVGAPGVENIKSLKLLSKEEIESVVGISFKKRNYLVTYHPETLNQSTSPEKQIGCLLEALAEQEDSTFIFTKANSDPGGMTINSRIQEFVNKNPTNSCLHSSLGHLNYLSMMKHCTGVIGNSSSALIETPTLKKGAINIGSRQNNRTRSDNIIDCENTKEAINKSFSILNSKNFQSALTAIENPYDGGDTSKRIVDILTSSQLGSILIKKFIDIL